MIKKIFIILLALLVFVNAVSAADTSNWSEVSVGYESFRIPPQYSDNPYQSDFDMYEFDEDIDEFTVRYVNPRIMDLYGYFLEQNNVRKVNVAGHDAVHFFNYDRHDATNNSKLWFSAGDEFYYITWRGENITPAIKEVVKSASPSNYSKEEFYSILDETYQNYRIVDAIESQRYDSSSNSKSNYGFYSFGTNGFSVGGIHEF